MARIKVKFGWKELTILPDFFICRSVVEKPDMSEVVVVV